ncbi:hypothetical protein OS493_018552 [Desmophyllum pertusum]|uniref:Uncharacterized protein n=1 Tax=Desmophyllum pertusum TaxID=174260 RepID=A0A9X0A109_9CNID|nr:hypothetical protein OS493_018552 [Desmophyllum pertusum]
MYALISWSLKNGVPLKREELEVQSSTKFTVMNGGKMEPGATVNLVFKKDIWAGTIQSIHDSKKKAEEELNREISVINEEGDCTDKENSDQNGKRNRKRKTFGDEFEETAEDEETNREGNDESMCSPVLVENNGAAKKTKKSSTGGNQKEKRILNTSASPIQEPVQQSVVPPHPHFGGKQPKQHQPPKYISVICREEKETLKMELADALKELADTKEELKALKALQPSTAADLKSAKYGKVPQSVAIANNWEEISNGVWCCPIKAKAAVKDASTRTALACSLLGIFYPKDEIKGRRLHELDQDVIEAITDFSLVAKLTKEPTLRKAKEGEESKPPSPVSRSGIKQAMRVKCNTVISLQKKKAAKKVLLVVTEQD